MIELKKAVHVTLPDDILNFSNLLALILINARFKNICPLEMIHTLQYLCRHSHCVQYSPLIEYRPVSGFKHLDIIALEISSVLL